MHSQPRSLGSPLRTVFLAVIAALVMMLATVPAWAQNSVPPTAVQAAKMPQFASRLAHGVKRAGRPVSPALARARMHRGPLDSNDIYDNGPINGNTDAWTINFGFVVSDTFTVPAGGATVTGGSFGMWLFSGDTLTSAELSITSSENGGTSYFDQTVNFTQGSCTSNDYGYNVCTATTGFTGPTLNAGTYWVNLQNASVPSGDPVYWDENSGPSSASQNEVGTIPSEAFTILGSATTSTTSITYYDDYACPDPQPGFHDLHDFSSTVGPSGLAIDTAGKLYGTFANGGSYGAGLVYDFAERAGRWFVSSLYSFLGGSAGGGPNGVIVGPGGNLYGAADGGILNCSYYGGQTYCGLIYEATPGATPCATALCSWNETPIYEFTGPTDAAGGSVTAFDSAGNLYGISSNAGAYGHGAVFELSPSGGGWTEKLLYSFTEGSDGGYPTSLLVGPDGNLYGTTSSGGIYNDNCYGSGSWCGVVFQLVPSGSGWTENVIYAFTGGSDGWGPYGLILGRSGGLVGLSTCQGYVWSGCLLNTPEYDGVIFALSPSGHGWQFNVVSDAQADQEVCNISGDVAFTSLAFDAAGNLYAAENGVHVSPCGEYCYSIHNCGEVLAVGSQIPLVVGRAGIFGNITSDANGNLYGTTSTCGFGTLQRTDGMIWQLSP